MKKIQYYLPPLVTTVFLLASTTVSAANDHTVPIKKTAPLLLAEMHPGHGMHGQDNNMNSNMQKNDMMKMDHSQHQNMGSQQMRHDGMKGMEGMPEADENSEQSGASSTDQVPAKAADAPKE